MSRMQTSMVLSVMLVTLVGCQNYPVVLQQTTEPGKRATSNRSTHRGRWLFKRGVGVGTPTSISELLPPETSSDPTAVSAAPTYSSDSGPLISDPAPTTVEPLIIPASNTDDPAPVFDSPSNSRTHTVAKGDTLWSIANQFYGSGARWKEIANANPGINPKRLRIGQSIVIP